MLPILSEQEQYGIGGAEMVVVMKKVAITANRQHTCYVPGAVLGTRWILTQVDLTVVPQRCSYYHLPFKSGSLVHV